MLRKKNLFPGDFNATHPFSNNLKNINKLIGPLLVVLDFLKCANV